MKGSIRQRGTSYTALWSTVDPASGTRRQHSKVFAKKGDAQKHLNAVLAKVDTGEWKPDQKITVAQLLGEVWLPAQRSRNLRVATLDQYEGAVEHWIVPHIGAVPVVALTPKTVQELVDKLRTEKTASGRPGLSARSAQLTVGVLKAATAWAVRNGLLGRDPIVGVDRPRVEHKAMAVWNVDEARRFLAATKNDRLGFAWALLLARGLRRGELCGLRWSDVDLEASVLHVSQTRIVVDGKAMDSTPKTNAGRRTVPLDGALVGLLRAHRARQAAEKLAAGPAYDDGGWLVADELGNPYFPSTISVWFNQRVKQAGLRRLRLHDCRHTAASLMLADGVPVPVVSEMLGHSSPTITLAVYAHVLPGQTEKAGAALSASLLGSG